MLEFVGPSLAAPQLTPSTRMLYSAVLRVFLVLLHDFPDFLSGYYLPLVNLLPPGCVQIRNLILSAFPPDMRLPDPFTPNLKLDSLPEMKQSPLILFDYTQSLISNNLKHDLDTYLKSRTPSTFLNVLGYSFLSKDPATEGGKYNVSLMNDVVLYIGVQLIGMNESSAFDIFQSLLNDLDSEGILFLVEMLIILLGRYMFLSCLANQLRFPNSHTFFFSNVILELFNNSTHENMKEQVTR